MIKITVLSTNLRENQGVSKLGKPYHMYFQTGWAFTFDKLTGLVNPYPEKIELILETDKVTKHPTVYAVGDYELHPASIFVGQYGLEVAPKLVPLNSSKRA